MTTISQPSLPTPLRVSDVPVKMAKASIPKADTAAFYAELGACIEEVRVTCGLTLKEFAFEVGKDERQLARQIAGVDRPQLEAVLAVERFRPMLVIALAKRASGMRIDTVVTFEGKRIA